jgi:hypothetical protein
MTMSWYAPPSAVQIPEESMSPWPDARFQWAEQLPAPLLEALPTEPWLRVAPAVTAATPQPPVMRRVERHVLLQPAGRLDGVVGLLAGLTLLALPIIGAIALGSWHAAPPAPKRTVTPVVQAAATTMPQPLAPIAPATDGAGAPMPPMGSEAATPQATVTPVATRVTHALRRRVTTHVTTPAATSVVASSRRTSPASPVHAVRHPASHVAVQPAVAASTPVVAGGGDGTVPPAQAQVTPTEQPAVVETGTS